MSNAEVFGGCPECGAADHILNVRKAHWGICPWHETAWYIGENLFGSWRGQAEAEWAANADLIESYERVESVFPWVVEP